MNNNSQGWLRRILTAPIEYFNRLKNKITSQSNVSEPAKSAQMDQKLVLNLQKSKTPTWRQFRQIDKVLSKKEKIAISIVGGILLLSIIVIGSIYYFEHRIFIPKNGGEYTEGLVGAPQFVNPIYSPSNDVDMDLVRLVYSGLMKVTPDGKVEPDLAESYEISEDGKEYTFHIRGDARWHDGNQVTADDVLFTFDSIQDPNLASPLAVSFRGTRIEKIDDLTIKFTLDEPFSPFLTTLTVGILPRHLWMDVPTTGFQIAEFNRKPIGSGPFKFKSFTRDKRGLIHAYNLERNEDFYGKAPYIEELSFKFYPTFEEGINALNNKNIQGLSYLPKESKEDIHGRKDLVYYTPAMPQYTALFFNQKQNTLLEDDDVRRALALATIKDEIVNDILDGEGTVVHSPIPEGSIGYHPDVEKIEPNISEANTLLDETKWKFLDQNDTYRAVMVDIENEEGETYEEREDFTLSISTVDTEQNIAVAEEIREQWERVGIYVDIKTYSSAELQRDIIKNHNFEILLFGEILGLDPDPYPFWHSSQIGAGLNLAQFANRDADKLLEDARTESDPEVRQEKYQKFQEILADKIPAIFLYSPTYTYPVTNKVKGIELERITIPADRFSGIYDWYIKTKRAWE